MTTPSPRKLDSTLDLFEDGYLFVTRRCNELDTDLFQTRLLLEPTICMRGRALAQLFYDQSKLVREDAAPDRVLDTLFGRGGVQGLDGDEHEHRKAMFMRTVDREAVDRLRELVLEQWRTSIQRWRRQREVVLFDAVQELLFVAACRWLGVPVSADEIERRTADVGAMIDGSGGIGRRYLRARKARERSEDWIASLVERVRHDDLPQAEGKPLQTVSLHRDAEGELLERGVAAVELLNLLRPIVAIARYMMFAAHALHEQPHLAPGLTDERLRGWFVDEVRRYYPFVPMVAARARLSFDHGGFHFQKGRRVLLDLYGTNHHPAEWDAPETFMPERFANRPDDPFLPIPQGGGSFRRHHRCAGEHVTRALLSCLSEALVTTIDYTVPSQNTTIRLQRLPAVVDSGFVMKDVIPRAVIDRVQPARAAAE